MTSPVICFSGRIGSGKTSVSRSVAESLEASWVGFGDFVRATAAAAGLDASSREVLQDLGARLIHEHGTAWLCRQVIDHGNWDGQRPLVIDGIRHAEVLEDIIRQVESHPTLLIHLSFDGARDNPGELNAESRQQAEKHSTERDVLNVLPSRADLVVTANAPLREVVAAVLAFLKQRGY